ncbi:MAG: SCO1664 family protein [Marmoricola sp.]
MIEVADHAAALDLLGHGEIEVVGRLREASNQTFAVRLTRAGEQALGVYKPVSGEAPLWDFPDGTLAAREQAAYLVSEALGWHVVPPTLLRDGPAGRGMLQIWIETSDDEPVRVVPRGSEAGWLHVLDAEDRWGRPVSLVHEDGDALRRIALFDLVVNNTDRKGSHVLPVSSGHRFGIDHGVCFHVDDKVRTVLWGWAGDALTDDEVSALRSLVENHGLLADLSGLLAEDEVEAFVRRSARLLRVGRLPMPRGDWPPIPWPPL